METDKKEVFATLPRGWQKMNKVLSADTRAKLFAYTGDIDYMIVDKMSVRIKGNPVTMGGTPGIFSENALQAFSMGKGQYKEDTILKFIKDDEIQYGIVTQHENRTGVFIPVADHLYINTESYREGEEQVFKSYFVLIGEKNTLHDYKGFITEIGNNTTPTLVEETTSPTNLSIKQAGELATPQPETMPPTVVPKHEVMSEAEKDFWEDYDRA